MMMSRGFFPPGHLGKVIRRDSTDVQRTSEQLQLLASMGGGSQIPAMNGQKVPSDPGQNVYLHAVVDLGR